MSCDLDPINCCCWTHGVDIDPRDLADGLCYVGACEEDEDGMEEYDDEDHGPAAHQGEPK
jgi:hypothetical protein